MMRYKFIIIILLLPIHNLSFAQTDSIYIQPFTENMSYRVYQIYKYSSLTYEQIKDNKSMVTLKPNNPIGIGFGGSYKDFALNLAYGFNFMKDKSKGNTRAFDLQYHYFGRKFIIDAFIQKYKGFYSDGEKEGNYILYPDIQLIHYEVSGQYFFNNKKFSYKAAFNQNEKQIKSAGSFQVGGGLYYNKIKADSSLILKNKN